MFTLVYINGNLNRPETLLSFLQSNIGKSAHLQVDCVTPYQGTDQELINEVCDHLNNIDQEISVKYIMTQNASKEVIKKTERIHFIVIQINVIHVNN